MQVVALYIFKMYGAKCTFTKMQGGKVQFALTQIYDEVLYLKISIDMIDNYPLFLSKLQLFKIY